VSPPIGEALALDAAQDAESAFPVAQLAAIPAECEFVDVALQVLLGDGMESAIDAALEQGEEALGSVHMNEAAQTDIFIRRSG